MMQRLLILVFLGIFTVSCEDNISPSQIPSVVENTFKINFPNATDVEWDSYADNFEVDFEFKRTEHAARIDKAGNLLEYKYEIERDSLPPAILSTMKTEFADRDWDDSEVLVREKNWYYQMEIDGFFKNEFIIFNSLGTKLNNIKSWN